MKMRIRRAAQKGKGKARKKIRAQIQGAGRKGAGTQQHRRTDVPGFLAERTAHTAREEGRAL
jgi:hypothetical protein